MIHDLRAATGLPVALDDDACRVLFRPPLGAMEPATRPAALLRRVYRHPEAVSELAPRGLYFMYDGVALPRHRDRVARAGLRYDLTVLRLGLVGDEPVKTLGHYHSAAPEGLPYPELYQVVRGRAWFVLQRAWAPEYRVEQVALLTAQAGDLVLMPPGWGHVSINVGKEPLVLCNWIAAACEAIAWPYLERRGAAYHAVRAGRRIEWVANPSYSSTAPRPRARAAGWVAWAGGSAGCTALPRPRRALDLTGPLYTAGVGNLEALRFLVVPSAVDWEGGGPG